MAAKRDPKPVVYDRVPPQNLEAERAVLGAMFLNNESVGTAVEILHEDAADVFYSEIHQHVYAAMLALFRENQPIDPVTLPEQLKRDGHFEQCGGLSYLSELASAVPTSANIEYYAKIVLESAVLRKLITTCTQVVGSAYEYDGDVNELLDQAESQIFSIAQKRQLNPIRKVGELVNEAVERIQHLIQTHSGISGLPTGFIKLDEMLSGLQPSDMVVLAARPSVGKTALALNIAAHAAIRENKGVLVFSLEMSKEQLTQRLLCMEGRIDSGRLRSGFLAKDTMSKLTPAASRVYPAPIYIDDTPNITLLEIRGKARRQMAHHDVSLIIIDYLQLMSSPSTRRTESRQVEISEISRGIKGLARELRVPVLALSQLSREAEKDDSGTPKLSHLRESGSIEQDADVVLMLWRQPPHKKGYNEEEPAPDNLIKLSIAKQRNGPTGIIDLLFLKEIQRFESVTTPGIARTDEEPPEEEYDDTPF